MLAALKESEAAPSIPADCIRRLLTNLRLAKMPRVPSVRSLRKPVARAYQNLCIAGLLDPDEFGRCTLTSRGRRVLDDHPMGVDESVLEQFPEYLRYTQSYSPEPVTAEEPVHIVEPKAEYFEGLWAFHAGEALADNPYSADSVAHFEWKNGWSVASGS
ncbi:MAG: hypothetical protein GEU76_02275 [Alphaproteobacteria bacterium]|nr:hypothetical protein [Alphaproteobacteria bacterium]